jgi:hypothetical protein
MYFVFTWKIRNKENNSIFDIIPHPVLSGVLYSYGVGTMINVIEKLPFITRYTQFLPAECHEIRASRNYLKRNDQAPHIVCKGIRSAESTNHRATTVIRRKSCDQNERRSHTGGKLAASDLRFALLLTFQLNRLHFQDEVIITKTK